MSAFASRLRGSADPGTIPRTHPSAPPEGGPRTDYQEFLDLAPKHAVLLWTGESRFEPMFDSFAELWGSLRDWPVE